MPEQPPLRVVPLGGLGEFGLNCMVLERGDEAVVVDCGVMFPEDHMLGVDRVIPDLSYLHDLGSRLKAVVLTHGHEDHIGALPYFLTDMDLPVFATRFTAELLREKLSEFPDASGSDIREYEAGKPWRIGSFDVEGVHVTHSFVDACALAISVGGYTVVHSGDFKLDPTPIDGWTSGMDRLRELGDAGVKLLFSDSTNVERPGPTPSEREVRGYLDPLFAGAKGRVFVTTFASHIHRIAAIVSLCQEYGRRLVIRGRSLETNVSIATRTGHLSIPHEMLVSSREAKSLPRDEVCYLLTGCQGEPRSALSRVALEQVGDLKAGAGDTVIFSSTIIPGNDSAVSALINQFFKCGAEVYYRGVADVHVSGHGNRGDLRQLLECVRPEFFVPVHGEYRNLLHHARLARETGVAEENCHCLLSGDVLEIDEQGARRNGGVTVGRILVDGATIGDVDESVLRDRRHISQDGVVMVILAVSQKTGEVLSGPDLVARGLAPAAAEEEGFPEAQKAVVDCVRSMSPAAVSDVAELQEEVRLAVRRYFRKEHGARPVVVPYIVEL